jgi:hypothetical protein
VAEVDTDCKKDHLLNPRVNIPRIIERLYRIVFLVVFGIVFLVMGHLAGRLVGAALLALGFLFAWRWYRRLARRRVEIGKCPWCAADVRVDATVCPRCHQEVTPLYAASETE